jgi:hypothetical protein
VGDLLSLNGYARPSTITSRRPTAASSLRGERWPLSTALSGSDRLGNKNGHDQNPERERDAPKGPAKPIVKSPHLFTQLLVVQEKRIRQSSALGFDQVKTND